MARWPFWLRLDFGDVHCPLLVDLPGTVVSGLLLWDLLLRASCVGGGIISLCCFANPGVLVTMLALSRCSVVQPWAVGVPRLLNMLECVVGCLLFWWLGAVPFLGSLFR